MKRTTLAVCVAALALSSFAAAENGTDPTPATCDSASVREHVTEAKRTIDAGWARRNWRHGPKRAQARTVTRHIGCLERRRDRAKIQSYRAGATRRLGLYRAYREATPYRCQRGAYGTWAIPCYVIACESGFSWSAYNPSGARGPYQFLGWPVPWPVRSFRDKLAHHRQARALGLSNWVCA